MKNNEKAKRVFVVHGRNIELKDQIFEFLKSLELEPIDFNEAQNLMKNDPTPDILKIINRAFEHAQAIVVLLTPDDLACLLPKYVDKKNDPSEEKNFMLQARQNVVFEAGLAYGKKRKRTIIIQIGRPKIFSDLSGKIVLKLDSTEVKRKAFISKLKIAKCSVNDTNDEWREIGDFRIKREPTINKEILKIIGNIQLPARKYRKKSGVAPMGKRAQQQARRYLKPKKRRETAKKNSILILPDDTPWDRSKWIYRRDKASEHMPPTQNYHVFKDPSGDYFYANLPEGHTLDYEIKENSLPFWGKNVSFQLSYGKNGIFYIKTQIFIKTGPYPLQDGWIQVLPGNEFAKEYLEKWRQWRVWLPYEWKDKTWQLFKINIPELVKATYGDRGYEFTGLLGFRIRNEMSVSKIEIFK